MLIKKRLALLAISSLLAVSLCGCSGQGGNDASKAESSAGASAQSSSQESPAAGASSEGSKAESKDAESKQTESKQTESKGAETSESASSGGGESASKQEASSAGGGQSTQTTQTTQTQESGEVVYDDEGDVIATPTKYLSNSQMTVDISDKDMASVGEIQQAEFFTDLKGFEGFYKSSKDKYCLEKTDSGKGFQEMTRSFDEDFFKTSNVLVIIQSYDKDKGMEIGDTHNESTGTILDIYKDKPASKDKTAYTANIIIYKKADLSKMPEIKVYPAGELYTDEPDPDVIVSLGNDEEESHDISITEDGDIVYMD